MMKNRVKKNRGITLIALVISIIVLLLLSGITVIMITGKDGLIKKTEMAVKNTKVSSEKEKIQLSVLAVKSKKMDKLITNYELQKQIDLDGIKAEVISLKNKLIVKSNESNKYYEIDENGNVSEPKEKKEDKYAGDITKGGMYNGDSESTAYRISCIEDLIALSIATNDGNIELNIKSSDYSKKYIILSETLNFDSFFSYNDINEIKYGDINGDGKINGIYEELTKKDNGCKGFPTTGKIAAIFDGQGNEIRNIYINRDENAALFLWIKEVKNIGVTGKITSQKNNAAGICIGTNNAENCWNLADVTGNGTFSCVGGITAGAGMTINNSYNAGNIIGTHYIGGIAAGHGNTKTTVKNCYNIGNIGDGRETSSASGILGTNGNIIQNCYNAGKVDCSGAAGYGSGICSDAKIIFNCYNTANIKGNYIGGICAIKAEKIMNCYNVGSLEGSNIGGIIRISDELSNIYNCFNIADMTKGSPWGKQSGLISINSSNIKIKNCFSKGKVEKYWRDEIYSYGTCGLIESNSGTIELENCYYVKTDHINKAVNGMVDDPNKVKVLDEADEKFYIEYIDLLNSYVDEYNEKSIDDKLDTNGENLYRFKFDEEKKYPVFE